MQISVNLDSTLSPNVVGEVLLCNLNEKERWDYKTPHFSRSDLREMEINAEKDLPCLTLCLGFRAKSEGHIQQVTKYRDLLHNIDIFLYWDGDGTIVFRHLDEDWILYNDDMKNESEWKWADDNCWIWKSMKLTGYYNYHPSDDLPFVYE